MHFLSFKGTTHPYLLLISITYYKNQNLLSSLLINCISARPTPQTLSLKDDYTFSTFLISGLFNSSANSWFGNSITCSVGTKRVFIKKFINHETSPC